MNMSLFFKDKSWLLEFHCYLKSLHFNVYVIVNLNQPVTKSDKFGTKTLLQLHLIV